MQYDLKKLLDAIDPSALSYDEWLSVGFALHQEGYDVDVWDQWSAKDTKRYKEKDCNQRWQGFGKNGAQPITGGTLVEIAKRYGWQPDEGGEIGWDDVIGGHGDELRVIDNAWLEEKDIPQPPAPFDGVKELTRYLRLLFDSTDNVGYVTQSYTTDDGRRVPTKGSFDRTAGQLIEALQKCGGDLGKALGDYDPDTGAWIRFNPLDGKGVKNDNVTEYRYALVESDTLNLEKQYSLMLKLQLPIAVMVHSGGKSIHAIVKIDAGDYAEYRQRVDYLYAVCQKNGLNIDSANRNPSRLSRMPGVLRKGKPQYILAENVGCASFPEWKEYIEGLNDDLPDMENLEEQMQNLPPLAPELIQGVLRKGHKLLLSGPSKAGKSYALIELCIAIAEGVPWMGLPCATGGVLYVNLELDRASCLHRFQEVYQAMGIQPRNPDAIDVWNLRGRSCPMDKLAPKLIRRALKKGYTAVIIDPIYKVITGDENSADQMAAFCNQFDRIATELGCAVIYCHHHSKGSQGQKNSMDRASGSGVFARDPDALLDMIELEIPTQTRDEMLNRVTRETCMQYLKNCVPNWREEISQDEECSHVSLLAACERLLNPPTYHFLQEQIERNQRPVRFRTGWRVEGVLREFAPLSPRYLWFDYPAHKADETGILKDLAANGEKHGSIYKAQSARKEKAKAAKLSKKEELRNALLYANGGEDCTVKNLAEYMGTSDDTVRKWLTRNGFAVDKKTHFVKEIQEV